MTSWPRRRYAGWAHSSDTRRGIQGLFTRRRRRQLPSGCKPSCPRGILTSLTHTNRRFFSKRSHPGPHGIDTGYHQNTSSCLPRALGSELASGTGTVSSIYVISSSILRHDGPSPGRTSGATNPTAGYTTTPTPATFHDRLPHPEYRTTGVRHREEPPSSSASAQN